MAYIGVEGKRYQNVKKTLRVGWGEGGERKKKKVKEKEKRG